MLRPAAGVEVRTGRLNHPGGATGYRLEAGGRSVCYVTDTEHPERGRDPDVIRLIEGADLVIYDCTYTDQEYGRFRGWGHSTWEEGLRLCRAAGAHGNLVPDAFLAALALESGSQWITTDRDFARFPGLRWRHPLDGR